MSYVDGFIVAVPTANKEAYRKHAEEALPLFKEFGATRMVEGWGVDVPDGKVTDFKRAVKAEADETVMFSWVEYPDKATRDAAGQRMMSDPRMEKMADMPFDGNRMVYGGFESVFDSGSPGGATFIDGFVAPCAGDGRDAFAAGTQKIDPYFLSKGALRVFDGWGNDVPVGKVTDFRRAVAAEEGEVVVFGWIEWPDKETRDAAFAAMGDDPDMQSAMPGFDMKRAIFGGFSPIVDG
jgi:uncharacterized protein YbaA (DUF1428 family)